MWFSNYKSLKVCFKTVFTVINLEKFLKNRMAIFPPQKVSLSLKYFQKASIYIFYWCFPHYELLNTNINENYFTLVVVANIYFFEKHLNNRIIFFIKSIQSHFLFVEMTNIYWVSTCLAPLPQAEDIKIKWYHSFMDI